jgi:mannose-6-phosphate isomerase-like protein (cupin superfamily)
MHPILPLSLELAWADAEGQVWDSQGGANYHYQFNMIYRGWKNYLGVGISQSPHGGVGYLHYRNLLSIYFGYGVLKEVGREVDPWMFDAYGNKNPNPIQEQFFTMDYLDLHILRPSCGIGLHRHRDNQEIFFMMEGTGLMFCGDWCQLPSRDRCLEARYLTPGSFSLIKPGGFHGLLNTTDENLSLLMFGGYD